MATEGLNKRSIGKVSMAPSAGLVGLVGTREEPLNLGERRRPPALPLLRRDRRGALRVVPRRADHPPSAGDGVLVVQQKERRQFDEGEEAFLVTMSAQLAGGSRMPRRPVRSAAWASSARASRKPSSSACQAPPGVGVGKAVVALPPADLEAVPEQVDDIDAEIALFKQAPEGVRADIRALSSKLASQLRKGRTRVCSST